MGYEQVLSRFFDFFMYYCSLEFTVAGVTTTVGAVLIWAALACAIIGFLKGMAR